YGQVPAVTLNAQGNITQEGAIVAGTLSLIAQTGAISQTGSPIVADVLTGSSAGPARLDQAKNFVANLASFSSAGGLTLHSVAPGLTVSGEVQDRASITLREEGKLTISGSLTAPVLDLAAAGVATGAGNGSVPVAGSITGKGSLVGSTRINLTAADAIDLSGATITTGSLSGAAGGQALLTGTNAIGALGRFSAQAGFALNDGIPLLVNGPVTDPVSIQVTAKGGLTLAGNLTAPIIALRSDAPAATASVPGGIFQTAGTVTTGSLSLITTGPILQTGGAIAAGALSGAGNTVALDQAPNQIGTLHSFAATGSFSLTTASALTVDGPVSAGTNLALTSSGSLTDTGPLTAPALMTLTAGGPIQLAGAVSAGTLNFLTADSIAQTGGFLAADTLSGSAAGTAQFGVENPAAVGTLGATSASSLTLVSQRPLVVTGPLAAATLDVSAPASLTLQGGTLLTNNAVLTVTPLEGAAALVQTGTTSVALVSGTTGALRLNLPANGGTLTLNDLQAGAMNLVLNLGSGIATGNLVANNLQVIGAGGSASLFGTVAGQTGFAAAAASTISPQFDANYQLNLCAISSITCGVTPPLPPTPIVTFTPVPQIASLVPKSFLESTLGGVFKPYLFTADLITIGIVRDPSDPELLLPNISDRDY
ncbi:MAG TPA: hypothetical protein VE650_01520, partial [Acetobacteraceae bacterium]|nr:hypothetical protein [Acetobacteraceae bacterium]